MVSSIFDAYKGANPDAILLRRATASANSRCTLTITLVDARPTMGTSLMPKLAAIVAGMLRSVPIIPTPLPISSIVVRPLLGSPSGYSFSPSSSGVNFARAAFDAARPSSAAK